MPFVPPSASEAERELKIRLPRADLERVFKSLTKSKTVRAGVAHSFTPRAYYDTQTLDLYRHGISLRVQYKAGKGGALGGYEQTVKFDLARESGDGGLFFRKECRNALRDFRPSIAAVADVQAKTLLKSFKNKKINSIFTMLIERRFFCSSFGRGKNAGVVEIAFDVGELLLSCNNRRYPFVEIECELLSGSQNALWAAQKKILSLAPRAKVQTLSKAQQGCRLYLKHFRR